MKPTNEFETDVFKMTRAGYNEDMTNIYGSLEFHMVSETN
jgi:hypothetical protein